MYGYVHTFKYTKQVKYSTDTVLLPELAILLSVVSNTKSISTPHPKILHDWVDVKHNFQTVKAILV